MMKCYRWLLLSLVAVACGAEDPADEFSEASESALQLSDEAFLTYRRGAWDPARDAYNPGGNTLVRRRAAGLYYVAFEGMGSDVGNNSDCAAECLASASSPSIR